MNNLTISDFITDYRRLKSVAYRYCRNRFDADDIVHNAYLSCYNQLQTREVHYTTEKHKKGILNRMIFYEYYKLKYNLKTKEIKALSGTVIYVPYIDPEDFPHVLTTNTQDELDYLFQKESIITQLSFLTRNNKKYGSWVLSKLDGYNNVEIAKKAKSTATYVSKRIHLLLKNINLN